MPSVTSRTVSKLLSQLEQQRYLSVREIQKAQGKILIFVRSPGLVYGRSKIEDALSRLKISKMSSVKSKGADLVITIVKERKS